MSAVPLHSAAPQPCPFFIVLNARSGDHGEEDRREVITRVLREAGHPFEFIEVQPGQLGAACLEAGRRAGERAGAIIAIGGDGTLNSAAQAALAHDCLFGAIAQGTFNLFAREHGLPLAVEEGTRALLQAEEVPVQVGLLNQRVFLVNATMGLYPQILEDRETYKDKLGRHRWVAVLAGVLTVLGWDRQFSVELERDGSLTSVRTPTLLIVNNRLQLAGAGVDPELVERVGQGSLVALVARPTGRWAKARLLWRALLGQIGASPEIDSHAFRSLSVASARYRQLKVATDGEVTRMMLPLRFAVSPKPLRLLKPLRAPEETS